MEINPKEPARVLRDVIKTFLDRPKGMIAALNKMKELAGMGTTRNDKIFSRLIFHHLSWVMITKELIDYIVTQCVEKDIYHMVSIGAGNGLLEFFLNNNDTQQEIIIKRKKLGKAECGTIFVATDSFVGAKEFAVSPTTSFGHVEVLDAMRAVEKYNDYDVMMVWPHARESFPMDVMRATKGRNILVICESDVGDYGGLFAEYGKEGWEQVVFGHPTWDGLNHDCCFWFSRKEAEIPEPPEDHLEKLKIGGHSN